MERESLCKGQSRDSHPVLLAPKPIPSPLLFAGTAGERWCSVVPKSAHKPESLIIQKEPIAGDHPVLSPGNCEGPIYRTQELKDRRDLLMDYI